MRYQSIAQPDFGVNIRLAGFYIAAVGNTTENMILKCNILTQILRNIFSYQIFPLFYNLSFETDGSLYSRLPGIQLGQKTSRRWVTTLWSTLMPTVVSGNSKDGWTTIRLTIDYPTLIMLFYLQGNAKL